MNDEIYGITLNSHKAKVDILYAIYYSKNKYNLTVVQMLGILIKILDDIIEYQIDSKGIYDA